MLRIRLTLGALALAIATGGVARAQQPAPPSQAQSNRPAPQAEASESPLPGDWAPELLYGIISSQNENANDELERAAFAAGPAIVPQLIAALKDDRTASFAAQELAYISDDKALEALAALVKDPRDLNLRLYYYGALGEFDDARATDVLLDAIAHSESEPDRSVTEAAILALTVHTDLGLVPKLKALQAKIKDPVIQDDLDNAMDVIQIRGKAMQSPEWKNAGASIEQTVRTYFLPALEPPPSDTKTPKAAEQVPPVHVTVEHLVFSPDQSRALARVRFEVPDAVAGYDMVLQKKNGEWSLASVWLGNETERPVSSASPAKP
jgi:HEAT repeat protein